MSHTTVDVLGPIAPPQDRWSDDAASSSARIESISSFCSSKGITLIPNGITVVPAVEPSASRLTNAARK